MYFDQAPWATEELTLMADAVRKFLQTELTPHQEHYLKERMVDRALWEKAAEHGLLGASLPEEYGGMGGNFLHEAVIFSELGLVGEMGFGLHVHNIALHYVLAYGTTEQKQNWLPRLGSAELIGGIAMTEPGTGSDLQAVRTTAVKEGDDYIINGQKTFISNGQIGNFFILVAKTDTSQGAKGVSLFGIETDQCEGFKRGRNLDKIGLKSQDTSELFFEDMRVPASSLLGNAQGQGFVHLMTQLPWERLMLAIAGVATADYALSETIRYTTERKAFGKTIMDFQNTRFKLAEAKTKIEVSKAFVIQCISKLNQGALSAEEASMAKWWVSQIQNEVVDECLQLHGGYGYMMEYPIAKMFIDSRVQKIYGGTNEIMKEMIARSLGV